MGEKKVLSAIVISTFIASFALSGEKNITSLSVAKAAQVDRVLDYIGFSEKTKRSGRFLVKRFNVETNADSNGPSSTPASSSKKPLSLDQCLDRSYNFNQESLEEYQRLIKRGMEHTKNGGITIFVDKAAFEMDLYIDGTKIKTYPIDLGWNPYDDKGSTCKRITRGKKTLKACTPEGIFKARYKGHTKYHKALLLGVCDGCLYEIHGKGDGKKGGTWTYGCVAVSNSQMDDLLDTVGLELKGTRLDRMGKKAKRRARNIEKDLQVVIVKYGLRDNYCELK